MRNFERVLALALVLAPLAAKAAGNGYYTDFMYDNYVRDAGRRPVVVLGSMEYAREPERRERSGDDGNIGWFDLNVGLDSLGSYGVAQGGDMLGGLDLDSDSAIGYGVKLGFDIFDKFLGLEVDFEGSSHGGISPSSSQSSGFQTVIPAGGGSSYFDENGDPVSIPAWPETPILQNYSQNLSFFQGGLNLVFNFGGSDSAINPFVGIGGG
ncbi:MAG: hypothetical protein LBI17_02485, partial [Rickettsiales bacterium]|nr:hypothetical protein [Rickettsiales bacterium]